MVARPKVNGLGMPRSVCCRPAPERYHMNDCLDYPKTRLWAFNLSRMTNKLTFLVQARMAAEKDSLVLISKCRTAARFQASSTMWDPFGLLNEVHFSLIFIFLESELWVGKVPWRPILMFYRWFLHIFEIATRNSSPLSPIKVVFTWRLVQDSLGMPYFLQHGRRACIWLLNVKLALSGQ